MKLVAVLIVFLGVLSISTAAFTGFLVSPQETTLVERVIDGDTVVIEGDERVRLIGIDTTERGQFLFAESTFFLKELIEGKRVRLEKDITDRDKYDRLLRYIYLGDTFVNLEMVKRGYASVLLYEPDTEYASLLLEEEAKAREQSLGIWSYTGDLCLGIFYLHSNAKGNDNQNLNDEYVSFRNKCTRSLDLSDWILKDAAKSMYTFPPIIIKSKSLLTLHTGSGKNNATDLFWGKSRAVWNNNGDSLFLWNSDGAIVLNYTYT